MKKEEEKVMRFEDFFPETKGPCKKQVVKTTKIQILPKK